MIPWGYFLAPSRTGYSFKIFFTFILRCAKFWHWYFLLSVSKKLSSNARSIEINFIPMGSELLLVPHWNTTLSLPNEIPLVMDAVNLLKSTERELRYLRYSLDTDIDTAVFTYGKETKKSEQRHTTYSTQKKCFNNIFITRESVFMFFFRFRYSL